LFIEDEQALVRALKSFFRRQPRYELEFAADGNEALRMLNSGAYAVVIIDWNLPKPGPSGLELCHVLRAQEKSSRVGILFATGRDTLDDKLRAFEAGADDYIVKPFDARELMARLDALAVRSTPPPPAVIDNDPAAQHLVHGPITIDLTTQIVVASLQEVALPKQQFLILVHLVRNLGRPVSEEELRENVLRTSSANRSSTIRNLVGELRQRLGPAGKLIRSVRGAGYCIDCIDAPEDVRKK